LLKESNAIKKTHFISKKYLLTPLSVTGRKSLPTLSPKIRTEAVDLLEGLADEGDEIAIEFLYIRP
jgi:hypothetical protein